MNRLKKLKNWVYKKLNAVSPGKTAVKGASRALLAGAIILYILFSFLAVREMQDTAFFILLIGFALLFVVTTYLLLWLLKKFDKIPRNLKIAVLISAPLLQAALSNEPLYWLWATLVLAALGAVIAVFASGNFKNITLPKKWVTILGSIMVIIGLTGAAIGFIPKGFELDPITNAASLSAKNISPIQAPSPATAGTYTIKTLTYGSGKDRHRPEFAEEVTIKTDSVNGVPFLDSWDGASGWYREKYWGFDASALPVNGRVWYPEGEGPFPLALIVHGNHSMQDFSDTGYEYLGKLMASRGIIFASVDENFLNSSWSDIFGGLDEENDARGWMLLEHLKTWHLWNKDPESQFYNKIDTTKLALLGHSRGGEAVGHAAFLNKLPYYSDDATITLDYNFDIKSIVAIAPVDKQYEPGNSPNELDNISYLTIHGSQDGDVTSFAGSQQYERITFTDSTTYFKSGLYIQGANHGQFNTSWGDNDVGLAETKFLNNAQLLSKEDQEQIAQVYISAFLETTLKENETYKPLFIDARKGKEWLPETIYLNQYEDASFTAIASFDEDFNVTTTSDSLATIRSDKLTVWREQEIDLKWAEKGSRAAFIGWHYDDIDEGEIIPDSIKASYTIVYDNAFAKTDSTSTLTFSLAESTEDNNPKSSGKWVKDEEEKENSEQEDSNEEAEDKDEPEEKENEEDKDENKPEKPIDFTIYLTDGSGAEVQFLLSDFSALQREINVRIWKAQFITSDSASENVFQTFVFPLKDIQEKHPNFNIKIIKKIQFIFDKIPEGVIILDNLGFMKSF